ncbi:hypothetical protein P3T40_004393 [Paraburkholderia sp. EB58]
MRRKAGYATSRIGGESLSLDLDKRMLRCNGVAHPFKREVERAFCKLRMLRLSMMIEPFRHALAA